MINAKDKTERRAFLKRAALTMLSAVFAVMLLSAGTVFAGDEDGSEGPIREVHKVGVAGKAYCFFVTHNVVLTPEEIAEMDDEQLTDAILTRSGLYVKEANCNKAKHKAYTAEEWEEGILCLSDPDIQSLRAAAPEDGDPQKFYMDLRIAVYTGDEENPFDIYTTYKKTSPRLLFVVVATEEDAKLGEDICEAIQEKPKKEKIPSMPGGGGDSETLPEYRTVNMEDRSGEPVEDTLEDGDPVNLEWIEPGKSDEDGKSFIDYVPGRYWGLAAFIAALAALIIFIIIKRRRDEED